ncbi:SUMF1/EgtB/PvdO family nonheme iron enzyme [Pedobacter sp. SYSU D00535]|uniref:type IX secretion system lipoprotein PorK/GldK n=1 Tax=Pedobacter sp. SYSU D00535 TaxID=2810308 RepID=UPI001A974CC1|nr:SUMF1/EgtB/PvdO family nonheme iron enzyme [Pedobacter sp. SYSU D00535]
MKTNTLFKLSFRTIVLLSAFLTSCKSTDFYEPPTVNASRGKTVFAPPGMVYIPSGTILYKSETEGTRKVSLSPFFMDATEVTNFQYREFVNWVADSIAVTDILKDEKYFVKQKGRTRGKKGAQDLGAAAVKQIDWEKIRGRGKTALWQSSNSDIQSKLIAAKLIVEEGGKYILNKELVKYSYYFRPVSGPNTGKYTKESVSIIPETGVWVNDFPNSQMEIMAENYYNTKSFNHHPVVGVNWKQARAYCNWRGKAQADLIKKNNYLRDYNLTYNLPTEAQWQYAASGISRPEKTDSLRNALVTYTDKKSKKEQILVNFKQEEGEYAIDGSTFTLPVKTYAPNAFGLYNMGGNVSEWTLDAFSPSALEFVHDLNPVLQYDADDTAPVAMKRKVVRGGSWKDSGKLLDYVTRNYEQQDATHSYIGFRCVMSALEVVTDQVRTRKSLDSVKESKKKSKSKGGKKGKAKEQKEDLKSASIK